MSLKIKVDVFTGYSLRGRYTVVDRVAVEIIATIKVAGKRYDVAM